MTDVHRLSRIEARRIAVRAQALTRDRPVGVVDTVRRLSLLNLDPVSAIAPSAELVLWSRIGSSFRPQQLRDAVDEQRLIEHRGMLRPAEDMELFQPEMAIWPGDGEREWERSLAKWVEDNDVCRRDILERLRADGPLTSRDLPDTCARPWRSTGWTNRKNVTQLLGLMVQRGEVAVAGRHGRDRLWDLAERVYPSDELLPLDVARRRRDERRLRALGIARSRAPEQPVEPLAVGEAGEPAVVTGVDGEWRVDPAQLGQPFRGRAALLSPFDLLVQDRTRMAELFEFEYILEMYKPAAKRRWGYYALPILYGDRLVGKLDATADRKQGELRIDAVHRDVAFSAAMSAAIDREIADLAAWLHLPVTRRDRP